MPEVPRFYPERTSLLVLPSHSVYGRWEASWAKTQHTLFSSQTSNSSAQLPTKDHAGCGAGGECLKFVSFWAEGTCTHQALGTRLVACCCSAPYVIQKLLILILSLTPPTWPTTLPLSSPWRNLSDWQVLHHATISNAGPGRVLPVNPLTGLPPLHHSFSTQIQLPQQLHDLYFYTYRGLCPLLLSYQDFEMYLIACRIKYTEPSMIWSQATISACVSPHIIIGTWISCYFQDAYLQNLAGAYCQECPSSLHIPVSESYAS